MKKLKLIYNPYSGDKSFKFALDACIAEFQSAGYETHVFRSMETGDMDKHIQEMPGDYDLIVVSGGDGTINIAVNAMMRYGKPIPLGIIPSGTANDFASFLKMPKDPAEAARAIMNGKKVPADLGVVNDRYFINVCGAGLFTNISQHIDTDFKDTLGKLAYYIKGLEQLPKFMPVSVRITRPTQVIEESIYLFIVLNSSGTGGFGGLSPGARMDDGLLDFIAIKERPIMELAVLYIKYLTGNHLEDSGVIFFRDSNIKVEILSDQPESIFSETDIDGECGPDMPVEIKSLTGGIELIVPEQFYSNVIS